MHLFSDYIQPLTVWLQIHPEWALFFAFIIAFAESLAVIGSIIPGSVTMTAIGILAGSGVMRVDLTLIAAILGATAGDGFSYLLGYTYSEQLNSVWPFRRYPTWLAYGKEYFARHGGKSVLIGRFVGPLRSMIPVIAGMMHMSKWRFFTANIISAVGWSFLYVLPGVLIGAASSELSAESATRLFALVLLLLGGLWLLSITIKWLLTRINNFIYTQLQDFCLWSNKHPRFASLIQKLTPPDENSYFQTIVLSLGLLLSLFLFLCITLLVVKNVWLAGINEPSHFFLQSLRIYSFDVFFIAVTQFISELSLLSLMVIVFLMTLYFRDWRTMNYWLSLNLTCMLVLLLTHWFINSPRPVGLSGLQTTNSYPSLHLTIACAQFTALLFYLNKFRKSRSNKILNSVLLIILLIEGFALVYLGDNWVTDILGAYLCGLSISLFYWLLYRRQEKLFTYPHYVAPLMLAICVISTFVSSFFNYESSVHAHQPYLAQYVFTDELWWGQSKPLLPIYRVNRIGKRISFFNLQYAGNLSHLESSLLAYGWHKQHQSLLKSIIKRVNGQQSSQDMPLMAQLYLNRKPTLIMTYEPTNSDSPLIIRIWRSNYHLKHFCQPIWLGTVNTYSLSEASPSQRHQQINSSFHYVTNALPGFSQRRMPLKVKLPTNTFYTIVPLLLLIKEVPQQ